MVVFSGFSELIKIDLVALIDLQSSYRMLSMKLQLQANTLHSELLVALIDLHKSNALYEIATPGEYLAFGATLETATI